MKKKTLAALLAALMALMLVLSACAKSDADDDNADADESTPPKTGEKAETGTEEESEDKSDEQPAPAAQAFYKEQRWYNEDGVLIEVDYLDEHGHFIRYEICNSDGEVDYIIDLRITDACNDVDTAAVAAMDGAEEVEVRQVFSGEGVDPAAFVPDLAFYVLGYNRQGELVGMQLLTLVDVELSVHHTTQFTCDADGNEIAAVCTASNGDVYYERSDKNEFEGGKIQSKTAEYTYYGEATVENGRLIVIPYDSPVTKIETCRYVY